MKATCFVLGLVFAVASLAHAKEKEVEERVPSTHANGKVEIDIAEGSIRVIGWDRNEVEVTGTIGDCVERLEVRKGRRKVWVRAYVPKDGDGRHADLTIRAPHNNDIDAQLFQGPISISGIEGDMQLETFSGDVKIAGPCKRVEARTVNGDITIEAPAETAGVERARLKTATGVVMLRNVVREAEVQTICGDVTIAATAPKKVVIETVSGNVNFAGGLSQMGLLEVDTHAGNVVGVFPDNLLAEFDITSLNGEVENAFNPEASSNQDYIQEEADSQAEIRVTSFSGDIHFSKQSTSARPAAVQASSSSRKPLLSEK